MAAPPARARADYDYLIKLLLVGDSGHSPTQSQLHIVQDRNFMDKSWTHHERISATYGNGVKSFIDHVCATMGPTVDIRCPCIKCMNLYTITQEEVSAHLCINGIMPTYDKWIYHGEPIPHKTNEHGQYIDSQNEEFMDYDLDGDDDEFETLMEDINRGTFTVDGNEKNTFQNRKHTRLKKMVHMLDKELYPRCKKYSILSFVIKLLHLKVFNHWTNKSIDMLLELMKDVLPDGSNLPKSYYEAKTMLREIGLGYQLIDACKYDCAAKDMRGTRKNLFQLKVN